MSETQKHTKPNVPNLRFPGFEREWSVSTIKDEFELYSGNTPSRLDKNNYIGEINWITSGELKDHYIGDTKEKISENSAIDNNLKLLPEGTFVIAIYGLEAEGVRATGSITKKRATISQACMAFTPKGKVSNEFLYSWYKKHGNLIGIKYAQGTKQQNLSYDIIERLTIRYPSSQEQKKLNSFISLLDNRIAIQNKVIEDIQALKKATASRVLFTKRGEKKTLGEITEQFSIRNREREQVPMYSVTNDKGFIPQNEQFEDREMTGEDITAYKLIHKGDIAYNPARINVGSIAQYKGDGICMISSLYVCIRAKWGISSRWLMHILKSDQLLFYYNLYAEGGVRLYLFYPNFARIRVFVPSFEEQERTADILDLLDNKEQLEKRVYQGLIKQKKSLLSKLFI